MSEDHSMDSGGGSGAKKALQDMSKEELMQKCKTLLALAQKAKVAKDGKWCKYVNEIMCSLFIMLYR